MNSCQCCGWHELEYIDELMEFVCAKCDSVQDDDNDL